MGHRRRYRVPARLLHGGARSSASSGRGLMGHDGASTRRSCAIRRRLKPLTSPTTVGRTGSRSVTVGACGWIAERQKSGRQGGVRDREELACTFVERTGVISPPVGLDGAAAAGSRRRPRNGSYTGLLGRLTKLDVLAIDDWMVAPLRDAERRGLSEVGEERAERTAATDPRRRARHRLARRHGRPEPGRRDLRAPASATAGVIELKGGGNATDVRRAEDAQPEDDLSPAVGRWIAPGAMGRSGTPPSSRTRPGPTAWRRNRSVVPVRD